MGEDQCGESFLAVASSVSSLVTFLSIDSGHEFLNAADRSQKVSHEVLQHTTDTVDPRLN